MSEQARIIGPYKVSDFPATPVEIDVFSDEDLSAYTTGRINIYAPNGAPVAEFDDLPFDGQVITFTFNYDTIGGSGVYTVIPTLSGPSNMITLSNVYFVADELYSQWHTLDSARNQWGGDQLTDVQLWEALEIAKAEVIVFAPELAEDAPVPLSYKWAQLEHARNITNAGAANPNGDGGPDSFTFAPFPLDWAIKARLRPKRVVGAIG